MLFCYLKKVLLFVAIIAASFSCYYGFSYLLPLSTNLVQKEDFNHYYATSWLILRGDIPYGMIFSELPLDNFIWHEKIPTATNPPVLAVILAPLALLEPKLAWIVWLSIMMISAGLSLFFLIRELGSSWSISVKLLILLMFFGSWSFVNLIEYSQAQSVVLLLIVLGWRACRSNRSVAAGLYWGIATALKIYTWPLLLFLLFRKNKVGCLTSATSIIVLYIVPVLFFGNSIYARWVSEGLPVIVLWLQTSIANVSVVAKLIGLWRVFNFGSASFDPTLVPIVFYQIPSVLLIVTIVWFASKRIDTVKDQDLSIAIISFAAMMVGPVAWYSYMIIYLFLLMMIWNYCPKDLKWGAGMFMLWLIFLTRIGVDGLVGTIPPSRLFDMINYSLPNILALTGISLWIYIYREHHIKERNSQYSISD